MACLAKYRIFVLHAYKHRLVLALLKQLAEEKLNIPMYVPLGEVSFEGTRYFLLLKMSIRVFDS